MCPFRYGRAKERETQNAQSGVVNVIKVQRPKYIRVGISRKDMCPRILKDLFLVSPLLVISSLMYLEERGWSWLFIKEDLSFEQVSKNNFQAFESTSIQISTESAKDVIFHILYRPPNLSKLQFLDEFGMYLEGAALSGCGNILLGDLNFHLDQRNTWTLKFYDIM